MNPEIKALWLEALRSGRYEQTTELLCRVDEGGNRSYCCLGVLMDLAVKAGVAEEMGGSYKINYKNGSDYPESQTLTHSVMGWAGIEGSEGELPTPIKRNGSSHGFHHTLAHLNDFGGYNFWQIADVIEEQF